MTSGVVGARVFLGLIVVIVSVSRGRYPRGTGSGSRGGKFLGSGAGTMLAPFTM